MAVVFTRWGAVPDSRAERSSEHQYGPSPSGGWGTGGGRHCRSHTGDFLPCLSHHRPTESWRVPPREGLHRLVLRLPSHVSLTMLGESTVTDAIDGKEDWNNIGVMSNRVHWKDDLVHYPLLSLVQSGFRETYPYPHAHTVYFHDAENPGIKLRPDQFRAKLVMFAFGNALARAHIQYGVRTYQTQT